MKKGLVISGGGSLGAYGGGTLERINKEYDFTIGISTGAIMSPFASVGEWKKLKNAYTSITVNDIMDRYWYKPRPITKKGKINILNPLMSLIVGDNSLTTTKNLRKSINSFFDIDLYNKIINLNKDVIVGSQNIGEKPSKLHYFNIKHNIFDDFKDWMWCSANFPPVFSIVEKEYNNEMGYWCDGGVSEIIPVELVENMDCSELDIIVHSEKPLKNSKNIGKVKNLTDSFGRLYDAMRYDIKYESFYNIISDLKKKGVKITIWWLPYKLTDNILDFNKEKMLRWWEEGYYTAYDTDRMELI